MADPTHKKFLPLLLRLFVGAGLLAFLFSHQADLRKVGVVLSGVQMRWLLLAVFLGVSGEILTAYKWRTLVHFIGGYLPILKAVRVSFIGMFYNNFFPGSVGGDIVRVMLISPNAGGKARATASTFMQRNTGLAALFLVGLPASFLWPHAFTWQHPSAHGMALNCSIVLVVAAVGYAAANLVLFSPAVYAATWRMLRAQLDNPGGHALTRLARKLIGKLHRFHTELHEFRFWLPKAHLLSVGTQLTDVMMVWSLAHSLSLPVGFPAFLVIVSVISVLNLLPISINGIGTRELMYVSLLAAHGLNADEAIALSLMHLGMIFSLAAVGGLIQLGPARDVRPDRLRP